MTVIILKDNKVEKTFKKYFNAFVKQEIKDWTANHFMTAKEKNIDFRANVIYIIF